MTKILPASCTSCGCTLDLQVVDWDPTMPAISQTYRCPDCKAPHTVELPGQIVLAVRRIITRVRVPR